MASLWRSLTELRGDTHYEHAFSVAWRAGRAHPFVLDDGQQAWCKRREEADNFSVWMIARQRGKSFAAIFDDLMFAQRTPGGILRYLGQTGDSAMSILGPTLAQIFAICPLPRSERPYPFDKNEGIGGHYELRWANGATLTATGTDNETFRRQRGPRSHRITYDEAGFYPKLTEVQEALNPSLQTTGGSPLYLSTPPVSPGHPFVELYEAASAIGHGEHETLYDNPRLTPAEIEKVIQRAADERHEPVKKFKRSTYFRREYLAEVCLDSTLAVIPEFPEARDGVAASEDGPARPSIIVERERPPHFDLYVSADPGMSDMTGVLFAVTDFRRAKLIIEHELLFRGANTATIAREVFGVLEQHYGCQFEDRKGLRRLARTGPRPHCFVIDDDQEQLVADLFEYHGVEAQKAVKDDVEASINLARLEISSGNVEINPRCVNLIRQCGNAVRKTPGGDMTRSARDGHWDLIAALRYLLRHHDKRHNPFPLDYGFDNRTQTRREAPRKVTLGDVMLGGTSLARKR